ncbi:MAG: hypothetical protein R3E86_14455 [Pseudomonadales bacterium]
MKRLCLLSPDVVHARRVVDVLKSDGIPETHLYVLARHGVDLEDLPDAGPESDDFLPAYERGLAFGGTAGLLAGLFAMAFPPAGVVVGGGGVLLISLFGAGLGGFLTGLAGAAFSSSRLSEFESAIEQGQLLVMADVPKDQAQRYMSLIAEAVPGVEVVGIEPPAPVVP